MPSPCTFTRSVGGSESTAVGWAMFVARQSSQETAVDLVGSHEQFFADAVAPGIAPRGQNCASLKRFPKRLNRARFPYGRESDSRFVLERGPVWDGEALFGGFAGTRGAGGATWRHDPGNRGAIRCEYQLCGTLPQAPPRNGQCQSGQNRRVQGICTCGARGSNPAIVGGTARYRAGRDQGDSGNRECDGRSVVDLAVSASFEFAL